MTNMTAEQIAQDIYWALSDFPTEPKGSNLRALMVQAIEADRAQRQLEIYIVQNDTGDVVDVFRDADEATEAYQDEMYSVVEETIWEPGEYDAAHEDADGGRWRA